MDQIETFFLPYIKEFVPAWNQLEKEDIKITKTIGITNKTYIIEAVNAVPKRIIFRHFGHTGEGLFLDRDYETKIMETVARQKLGPSYYGCNKEVRIEEYLENTILKQEQMKDPQYYRKVAANLARFHELDMSSVEMDRTPLFERHLKTGSDMMQTIILKLESPLFTDDERLILQKFKTWFCQSECQFLLKYLPQDQRSIVYSHNDLLANNILLTPPDDQVVFIDYEYSSYNFRGFDIANYFIESQFNYTNPNPPYFYIENGVVQDEILKDFVDAYVSSSEGISKEAIFAQIHIGMLLAHYFWAAWALNMAKQNDLEFDYLSFIDVRYHKYYQLKQLYFPND